MLPFRQQGTIRAFLGAAVIGVLYRYWLTAPILGRLSVTQWHVIAFGVAVVIGVALVRVGLNLALIACSSVIGLVLGGIWAALVAPNDVTIPISTELSNAFKHSFTLWWQIAILTVAVTLGGFLSRALNRSKS